MNIIQRNIAANFVGNIWQALMGLAFIPLYIKFMGIESYGLIGIFATLQATFVVLNMGLNTALTREMARLSVLSGKEQEMSDLVRSLEVIYWAAAAFIGLFVVIGAPFIAHHWVKASQLSPENIEQALRIMGFAMALQWPSSLYSGGLEGLQTQVLLNFINMGVSTIRGVGALLVLWLVSPTILGFFVWQIIISVINTGILAFFLWQRLPQARNKASFSKVLILGVWRFAAGISGITVLAVILTQLDKIIISKVLSLELFGYYVLASTIAMNLYRVIYSVNSGIYPRLIQLTSLGEEEGLKKTYHKSCQLMSVLILPATGIIAMFSYQIMLIWTQNPLVAENTHFLLSILICGTALNGLMNMPYLLQLSYGWTKLTFMSNLIAVILLGPLIIYATSQYGVNGAAGSWVILNGGYVLFVVPLMHRRILKSEKWSWYWQDVFVPLLAVLLTAGLGRLFLRTQMSQGMTIVYLMVLSIVTLAVTAIITPTTRAWLRGIKLGC